MVLGIIGLVGLCIWFIGLPCAILGLIFGILGKKKPKETGAGAGMATAGIVCRCVALGLTLLGMIFILFFGLSFPHYIQETIHVETLEVSLQMMRPWVI